MKVRIGFSSGVSVTPDRTGVADLVDALFELGFDSLWVPEVLTAPTLDPLAVLVFAAAHQPGLKLGTTLLLPGRNLVRLAKELATIDVLSNGRLLVTFVPGLPIQPEAAATGLPAAARGAVMDDALPLLRQWWGGATVTHEGPAAQVHEVTVWPRPVQQPLEFWTGGMAPAALRRCGRLADGWLPSSCTPEEAASGRTVIEEEAARTGRTISPEHFGVSIAYADEALSEGAIRTLRSLRKGVDPAAVVPVGLQGLRELLERFLAVGFSKFVVRPLTQRGPWRAELEALAAAVLDLQT